MKEFSQYSNVYSLENINDHAKIHNAIREAKNVIIYGSDFEAYELATSVRELADSYGKERMDVIVIEPPTSELVRSFGDDIAKMLKAAMLMNGIRTISEMQVIGTSSNPGSDK